MPFQIDFMRRRRAAVLVSSLLVLGSLVALVFRGIDFGLDFSGGVLLEVVFEGSTTAAEVRSTLTARGFDDAVVQNFGKETDFVVRLPLDAAADERDNSGAEELVDALRAGYATMEVRRVEFVGPAVGEDLREAGGLALLASFFAIAIYVMWRFTGKFAVAAVVALVHDVLITIGCFAAFRWTFDLSTLGAVLAVIGYSLNDTIVICDRIRENLRLQRKGTVLEIINHSLNQTLERTLAMSGTTLLVLVSLAVVAGEQLFGFAIALIIGVVVGTYSSIYIAASYLVFAGLSRRDFERPVPEGEVPPEGEKPVRRRRV